MTRTEKKLARRNALDVLNKLRIVLGKKTGDSPEFTSDDVMALLRHYNVESVASSSVTNLERTLKTTHDKFVVSCSDAEFTLLIHQGVLVYHKDLPTFLQEN